MALNPTIDKLAGQLLGYDPIDPIEDDRGYVSNAEDDPGSFDPAPPRTAKNTEDELYARLGVRMINEISHDPPPPLLLGWLHPTSHTIIFGTGGIGKGTFAVDKIIGLRRIGMRVLIIDFESHETEWAGRIRTLAGLDFESIEAGIRYVAPLAPEWTGKKGALWDIADDLLAIIGAWKPNYIVIDSIVMACAGKDVSGGDTEAPTSYDATIQGFGVPVLSLAHTNRAQDLNLPFGSIFWSNTARLTWSMAQSPSGVQVVARKANNYKRPASQIQTVDYNGELPTRVSYRTYEQTITDQCIEVLTANPWKLATEVTALINDGLDDEDPPVKLDTVKKTLARHAKETGTTPGTFIRDKTYRYAMAGTATKEADTGAGTFRDIFTTDQDKAA